MRRDRQAGRDILKNLANDQSQLNTLPVPSLTLLSRALAEIGEANLVVRLLQAARRRVPGDVWINFDLAQALQQAHPARADEAIRFFTVAQSLRPETAHSLAHALLEGGQRDEAIAVFRGLARISPGNGRHHLCLGGALQKNGPTKESTEALNNAIAAFRAVLALAPNDRQTHYVLGLALAGIGALDEAIAEYRAVLRLEPGSAGVRLRLAIALREIQSLDEAIAEYRAVLRSDPSSAEAHLKLGEALYAKGGSQGASAEYRVALAINPNYLEARNSLGIALMHQVKIDEALNEFQIALRLDPEYAEAHYNLGNALREKGNLDLAIASYRIALRLNPGSFMAHSKLGDALYTKRQFAKAIIEYHSALRLRPEYIATEAYLKKTNPYWPLFSVAVADVEARLSQSRPTAVSSNGKSRAFFTVPYNAILYLRPHRSSAGSVSEFGLGTSIADHTPVFKGLPFDTQPDTEVKVGFIAAGAELAFYVQSESRSVRWAFSPDASTYEKTESDRIRWAFSHDTQSVTACVVFQDLDNSLHRDGSVIEKTGMSTWLMHLDDAGSAEFDDNDNDILIEIRLAPAGPEVPT